MQRQKSKIQRFKRKIRIICAARDNPMFWMFQQNQSHESFNHQKKNESVAKELEKMKCKKSVLFALELEKMFSGIFSDGKCGIEKKEDIDEDKDEDKDKDKDKDNDKDNNEDKDKDKEEDKGKENMEEKKEKERKRRMRIMRH